MAEPGPVTIREEDLDFAFDASWQVCSHWDTEPVRLALLSQASGSHGVDLVGLREGPTGSLYLIEVKDYRTSEKQLSTREKLADDGDPLADIVAGKVRDTVAGLVGAARLERDDAWRACVDSLVQREVWVVLWIEHAELDASSPVQRKRAKVRALPLIDSMKKRCRWLSAKVAIYSRSDNGLPGVTVRSVPAAARTRGRRA